MQKWRICCLVLLLISALSGCNKAIIDWVDFIRWNGIEYWGIPSGIISDEGKIGEKIGKVKHKVSSNVTNPRYKIKNGDAAFHEKGTEIYKVIGEPNMIAVKHPYEINGYRLYYSYDTSEYKWQFQDMPLEKVNVIEVYEHNIQDKPTLLSKWHNQNKIEHFLHLLKTGEDKRGFQPNMEKGDPDYYEMVFYTGETVAYKFSLQFDGTTYFWYPGDTAILSDEMELFIRKN